MRICQRTSIVYADVSFEMNEKSNGWGVVVALSNVSLNTLLTVGDFHQRVENISRGRQRPTSSAENRSDALPLAPNGLHEDGELYGPESMGVAHSSTDISKGPTHIPEARPWYGWC